MASLRQLCIALALLLIVASLSGCSTNNQIGNLFNSKPPIVKDVLGRGLDANGLDLWTLQDIFYTQVFEGMPESCSIEISCPNSEYQGTTDFETREDFKETVTKKFGLNLGFGWKGLGAGLGVGTGNNDTNSGNATGMTGWWKIAKVAKCAQLEMSCMRNSSYFSPSARMVIDDLVDEDKSTGATDDAATMQRWYDGFIQQFGSHIIKAVSHGAAIQASHSLDKSCKASESCRRVDVGFRLGFVRNTFKEFKEGSANLDLNHTQKKCLEQHACLKDSKTKCATLGGAVGALDLCAKEVPTGAVEQFMSNKDLKDDSSSVISMQFMPMQTLMLYQGFPREVRKKVEKAVEFANCKARLGSWTLRNSEHICKCPGTCKNGEVLNEKTCSCERQKIRVRRI